jgi:hypothetical protein
MNLTFQDEPWGMKREEVADTPQRRKEMMGR